MKTIAIVAVAKNNVIGKDNDLPWRLRNDLKYFKKTTIGHYILMGRKSMESLGKPLKGRKNLVITRQKDYKMPGAFVFDSIEAAIEWAKEDGAEKLFITGGGEIFKQSINLWEELYITDVEASPEGDIFFPKLDFNNWDLFYTEHFTQSKVDQHAFTIKFFRPNKN